MTPSRLRGLLLGATAAIAALVFLAWSQPWYTLTLVDGAQSDEPVLTVGGDVAAAGLAPLALTTLAVVAALAIAGPVFRRILGVLEALVGVAVIGLALVTIGDPVDASAPAVTDVTGITGSESVHALVSATEGTLWPWTAVVFGVLLTVVGVIVVVTAGRWPATGRKYTRTRLESADGTTTDAVAEWDALSDGDDPTAPAR